MPSVAVTLKYTPKPEGEAVPVFEGMRVYRHGDSVFIADEGSGLYGTDQHIEVPIAEALALARALALVAGCADDRWRGEPNGVYVAGPMTGLPDYNYPAFHAAAAELRSRGMVVANPAEHFDGDQTLPYGVYIREAVRSLIGCAEVVTLPGWENSRGARLEVDIAEKIGMPVTTLADKLAADDTPEAGQ